MVARDGSDGDTVVTWWSLEEGGSVRLQLCASGARERGGRSLNDEMQNGGRSFEPLGFFRLGEGLGQDTWANFFFFHTPLPLSATPFSLDSSPPCQSAKPILIRTPRSHPLTPTFVGLQPLYLKHPFFPCTPFFYLHTSLPFGLWAWLFYLLLFCFFNLSYH